MTRRLLAICWDMPPLSGPRAVQVSRTLKHLVPLGWESAVVCFAPRSNRYNQDHRLASRLRAGEAVTMVPVRSPEERFLFRALWRVVPPLKMLPDEKWVWIRAATRAALRAAKDFHPAVIVSFAQPWSDHLVGLRVHRATGLPWIAHFSDPWVDSPYLQGHAWQWRIWRRMEADVVRHAAALVFVNAHTANRVVARYSDSVRAKSRVVPHGFDPDNVIPECIANAAADARLRIVYTGRFYDGLRTPEHMLRALAALAVRRPLASELGVVFVGSIVPSHRRLASRLGLDGVVEFTGRLSNEESGARAASADVLAVIDAPAAENLFLPSKLVDYLPLDKPILALTPACGASADVVRALGYPVVPPDDEEAIASAIEDLLQAKRQGRLCASSRHRVVAEQYDVRRTTAAFAEVLAECA